MEFLEMLDKLADVKDAIPSECYITANESSGLVTIQFYAGLENTRLFNEARQLLADID